MKDVSIKKLVFLQGIVVCLTVFIIIGVFLYTNKQISEADEAQAGIVETTVFLKEKYIDHLLYLNSLKRHVYDGEDFKKTIDPTKCDFGKWYYSHKPKNVEEQRIHKALEDPHKRFHESAEAILKTEDTAKKKEILMTITEPLALEIKGLFDKYNDYLYKEIKIGYEIMDAATAKMNIFIISFLGILCAMSVGSVVVSKKKLLKPLSNFTDSIDLVSKGDITVNIDVSSKDEIGLLSEKIYDMIGNLKQTVQRISSAAHQMASASRELSTTAEDLSKNSTDQSLQAEQVASAMTEISQTIMDVAKNASDAVSASKDASSIALKGKKSVENSVNSMVEIAETIKETASTIEELGRGSNEIGNIIMVIDDIADQTNLLALNAAIEAARAGEQGRGFAVVADEVRKLAERSSKATREIAEMIKKIQTETERSVSSMNIGVSKVQDGVKLAEEAKEALNAIVAASEKAVDMVQLIAVAAEQQSAAAEEVSQSMENVSTITKRSSDANLQLNRAAADLSGLASEMQKIISWFRTASV
jgi:methyl-accepting chemotaxis protein